MFNYQLAKTSINLIDQRFPDDLEFKYVINEKKKDDFSVVGITNHSAFNNYLFEQDAKQGFRVIYRLDSYGNFLFKFGVYERDKFKYLPRDGMKVEYRLDGASQFHLMQGCVSNDVDQIQEHNYLAVSEIEYKNWVLFFFNVIKEYIPAFESNLSIRTQDQVRQLLATIDKKNLQKAKQELANFRMKISLDADKEGILGDIIIFGTELVDLDTFTLRVKPVNFDQFDYLKNPEKCDFFFGSSLLQKYNFKFYYVEYDLDYEFLFSFDMENDDFYIDEEGNRVPKSNGWRWIQMILVLFIVVAVGYFFWKTYW